MISQLSVVNEDKHRSIEYDGIDDVFSGYSAYEAENSTHFKLNEMERQLYGELAGGSHFDWMFDNEFFVLVEPKDGMIKGIRNYGKNHITSGELFVKTGYIPVHIYGPTSKEMLSKKTDYTRELFCKETGKAKEEAKLRRPLFVIGHAFRNNYWALDLNILNNGGTYEEARKIIYNYKDYHRDDFLVSAYDISNENQIVPGHGYYVYMPSKRFIDETGIELYPSLWQRLREWDAWEEREPWDPAFTEEQLNEILLDPESIAPLYFKAISLVNKGRSREYNGINASFVKLEDSLVRLERLIELDAPSVILNSQTESISKYMLEIEVMLMLFFPE